MTGEIPRPERVGPPVERLFNVDALNDDELVVIYRSIKAAADVAAEEGIEKAELGDNLCDRLALDVSDLAARDPERVKGLVNRCIMSNIRADQEFAVTTIGSLVHHDYEFTRDTLVSFYCDREIGAFEIAGERAMFAIKALMHDDLNSEQVEDFNAQIVRYGFPPL